MIDKIKPKSIIRKGDRDMEQSIFEKFGGTYLHLGNCLLPNLMPDESENPSIGLWARRHLQYLKEYRPVLYNSSVLSGRLNSYLADIEQQAKERLEVIVQPAVITQGITEELKAADPLSWVGKMNNIRCAAEEIVTAEIICG